MKTEDTNAKPPAPKEGDMNHNISNQQIGKGTKIKIAWNSTNQAPADTKHHSSINNDNEDNGNDSRKKGSAKQRS